MALQGLTLERIDMRSKRIVFEQFHTARMNEALKRLESAISRSESFVSRFATVQAATPKVSVTLFSA